MRFSILTTFCISLLLLFVIISCAPDKVSSTSRLESDKALSKDIDIRSQAKAQNEWQTKWENLLEASRKEGKVVIYSSLSAEPLLALSSSFKKRYGITAEFLEGRGGEIAQKLFSEKRAGLRIADIHLGGNTTTFTQLKPADLVIPIAPVLILPEVTENKFWFGSKLNYSDPEGTSLPFAAYAVIPLAINTNLVNPQDITSYQDLLNPRWKGKIILSDPTIAGGPAKWFGVMIMPGKLGMDFMRALARQEPIITRDRRMELEWIAKAKYSILIGPKSDVVTEFTKIGAPIKGLTPVEGTHWTAGSANLSLIKDAPHPAATTIFTNFLLSQEGQKIFVQSSGLPSARLDVSTEGIDPLMLLQPGINYFDSNVEDFVLKQPEQLKLAREIFGPLLK